MTGTFIAIDIETTGLDPEADGITEVGAVRFDTEGNELASFQTLVNPECEIPAFAEALTGIRPEDLKHAPPFEEIIGDLLEFAGEASVVGHNIAFDRAFLEAGGCHLPGGALDTVELARILLPRATSHALPAVAAVLGIDPGTSHRALADAQTAARVFVALLRRAEQLDRNTRVELARLAAGGSISLAEVIAGRPWEELTERTAIPGPRPLRYPPPLARVEEPPPPEAGRAEAILVEGTARLDSFEERSEQLEMARAVEQAFSGGGHWLIEAGTGVGKSLAYLVPAALHALRTGERVVISTNTIALQEQLLTKDLPALRLLLEDAGAVGSTDDLKVAILKGRGNYLCYRRWLGGLAAPAPDPDFARLASRILLWLPETETGDRSELNLERGMRAVWSRFSAEGADCLSRQHVQVREGRCFLARARKAAEAAHIVVVNHALLLADIAAGGSAIPAFEHLVLDEAHNLEDQATRQFGRRATLRALSDLLAALSRRGADRERSGGLASVLSALPDPRLKEAGTRLKEAVVTVMAPAAEMFEQMAALRRAEGDQEALVTRGVRHSDGWAALEMSWTALDRALAAVLEATTTAGELSLGGDDDDGDDLLSGEIEAAAARLESFREGLTEMISEPGANDIVWLAEDGDTGAIMSAPLEVGPLLAGNLFAGLRTAIATSATLGAAGSMRFTAERLGLPEAETLEVGSPFDYEQAAMLAEVNDIPDPGGADYSSRVAETLESLIGASRGRALVLFTSHAALRDAARRTRDALKEKGITVLAQDVDGSAAELVRILRTRPATAVYGTSSFWEGVDIRGDALSLLIIVRLPFAVPTDPIHRARSALKEHPFLEYALPAAILRFRQGFGRLIRDRQDRGAIVVLDRRVTSRSYGPEFLRALPPCHRVRGGTDAVTAALREWLELAP
ncbi:MAG: helicase C-terminal domain-containing protein [Dehalococcoidia bacterium]